MIAYSLDKERQIFFNDGLYDATVDSCHVDTEEGPHDEEDSE